LERYISYFESYKSVVQVYPGRFKQFS